MKLSLERAEAPGGSLCGSLGGRRPQSSGAELDETPGGTAVPVPGSAQQGWVLEVHSTRGSSGGAGLSVEALIPDSKTWWTSNRRKEVAHTASDSIRQPCASQRFSFFDMDHLLKSLLNLLQFCFCFMFCFFWPGGMWDLSSLTRD